MEKIYINQFSYIIGMAILRETYSIMRSWIDKLGPVFEKNIVQSTDILMLYLTM